MNASQSNCSVPDWLLNFTPYSRFFVYKILIFPYFLVGISGHTAFLFAFHRESKKEAAYMYQLYLTVCKIFEIFFMSILLVSFEILSGRDADGTVGAFQKCYSCQFFNARIALPMGAGYLLHSLFFTMAMTFDRLIAVWRPIMYRKMNHKLHHRIVLLVCLAMTALTGFITAFEFDIVQQIDQNTNQTYYELIWADSESFFNSNLGQFFNYFRSFTRVSCVLIQCAASFALALAFRAQGRMMRDTLPEEEQERRYGIERVLMILSVCQSCLVVSHQYAVVAFESVQLVLDACWNPVLVPFVDGTLELAETLDFIVLIAVSATMRRAFFKVVPLDKVWKRLKEAREKSSARVVEIT